MYAGRARETARSRSKQTAYCDRPEWVSVLSELTLRTISAIRMRISARCVYHCVLNHFLSVEGV